MAEDSPSDFERLRALMAGACVRPLVHDANNLLGAAMAYAELALMEQGLSPKTSRQLREVIEAVDRCSRLLNQFAQLVRPLRNPVEYPLAKLVQEAIEMRIYAFRMQGVVLNTQIAPDLPPVLGFPAATQYAVLAVLLYIEGLLKTENPPLSVHVSVEALGDHAAVRITFQGKDAALPAHVATPGDHQPGFVELSLDTAKSAIAMQNGHFAQRAASEVLITLPFAGSVDSLSSNPAL